MTDPTNVNAPKPIRCAVYTRKSTEEGLGQAFNSLDAQRESAEAYILSQRHDGWVLAPGQYSDGGYTGLRIIRERDSHIRRIVEEFTGHREQ